MMNFQREYGDRIDFYKVDTDKEQEISMSLGVSESSYYLFVPVGDKPKVSVGYLQKDDFEDTIKDFLKFNFKRVLIIKLKLILFI